MQTSKIIYAYQLKSTNIYTGVFEFQIVISCTNEYHERLQKTADNRVALIQFQLHSLHYPYNLDSLNCSADNYLKSDT